MRKSAVYAALVTVFLLALGVGSFAIAGGNQGDTSKRYFKADELTGYQETPGVSSNGFGEFDATLDEDAETLTYTLTYGGLDAPANQSHIHFGNRYIAGGVSVFLCSGNKPPCPPGVGPAVTVTGVITPADIVGPAAQGIEGPPAWPELVRALRAGETYANVHSTKFPAGEIRAQINDRDQRQP
jgi:hypothetical protein